MFPSGHISKPDDENIQDCYTDEDHITTPYQMKPDGSDSSGGSRGTVTSPNSLGRAPAVSRAAQVKDGVHWSDTIITHSSVSP